MSILNRPSDGLFNVILVLARCLLAEGPMPRDRLLRLCAPGPAVGSDDMCRKSLNTAIDLGLFADGDELSISPELPAEARDPKTGPARLRETIRERVLHRRNTPDVWATEDARAADFTRAAGWVLAQDPFLLHGANWDAVSNLQARQLADPLKAITNDTRWAGFRSWAVFLGFGWNAPALGFVPDPAEAIRAALPAVFRADAELDQSAFLSSLAAEVPVLDGGDYRTAVEGKLKREAWQPPPEGQVSGSLSLALLRLEREGAIRLGDRDDPRFGRRTLTGRGGRPLRRFTHVRLAGGA